MPGLLFCAEGTLSEHATQQPRAAAACIMHVLIARKEDDSGAALRAIPATKHPPSA